MRLLLLLLACTSKSVGGDEVSPVQNDDDSGDTGDSGGDDSGGGDSGGGDSGGDSGDDSGGDSGDTGEPPVLIQAFGWQECEDVDCTWSVEADGVASKVEAWFVPTGAAEFEEGCIDMPAGSGSVCGVWAEYHDGFRVVSSENDFGGMTRALTLGSVATEGEQVSNATTLYWGERIDYELTVLFYLTDDDGVVSDCATWGQDAGYFAGWCTNEFE